MRGVTVQVHLFDDIVSRSGHRSGPVFVHADAGDRTTGRWLVEYIRLNLGVPDLAPVVILRNGRPVMPADLVAIDIDHGDEFHCAPRPQVGIEVALIAIALASAALSAHLATKAKLPPIGATGDEAGPERRFGFGRFSNTAYVGDVIPVPYGHLRRIGGKIISQVPVESSDGSGHAKLKILIDYGHGPIQAIGDQTADFTGFPHDAVTGIYINDQPLIGFPGAVVSGRMGNATQAVIPGFADAETLREVGVGGVELRNTSGVERTDPDASGEAFTYSTVGSVNAVVTRIRFAAGLYSVGVSNQVDPRRLKYRIRWRLTAGPGSWSAWTVITVERAEQSEFFSSPRLDQLVGGSGAAIDVQVERVSVEPATGSITEVDTIFWDSIVEVLYGAFSYNGRALLAVEITAGEQLNGVPRLSVDLKGRKVRVWDGVSSPASPVFATQYTENPAWFALDFGTNAVFGMGAYHGDLSQHNLGELFAAAVYNDELVERPNGLGTRARFKAHLYLNEPRDLWDWMRTICETFRCVPTPSGSVIRYAQDRPQPTPTEVFTQASIACDEQGLPRLTYRREKATGGLMRPNQLVCQFENANADGQPDVLAYPQDGEFWLGGENAETVNPRDVKLEGVTDPDQVYAELIFRMNKIRYLTRTVRLPTTKRAVVAQVMDRVDVAADLCAWGQASGRVIAGAAAAVIIDKTVTFDAGVTYFIQVVHPDNTVEVRQVISPAGVHAAGTPLLLAADWTTPPVEHGEYSLGSAGRVLKPFTVTGVRIVDADTLLWELDLIEYVEGIYTLNPGPVNLPGYSNLPHALTPPGPVTDLRAIERTTNGIHQVVLSWGQTLADQQITASFRIYRRPVGITAWQREPHPSITYRSAVIELSETDRAYEFTVIGVSYGGAAMSPYDPRAPIVSIVMGLAAEPPPPPDNVALTLTGGNTYTLSWDPVEGATGYLVTTRGGSGLGSLTGPGGGLIGPGTRDAMVHSRVAGTSLAGLELTPGYAQHFYVRATIGSGRMSFESSGASQTGAVPAGESVKQDVLLDSTSGGTLTNASWVSDGVDTILRATSPDLAGGGVWTSPVQDSGSLTLTELNVQVNTKNDWLDALVSALPLPLLPSIAADQWGLVDDSPDRIIGMLQPPYPDDEHAVALEIRTHDGSAWSAWQAMAPCASVRRTFREWQFRVAMTRRTTPYRLAVLNVRAVLTH